MNSIASHSEFTYYLLWALIVVAGYFITRTLSKIDKNQADLSEKINDLSIDFYILKGEHAAIRAVCVNQHPMGEHHDSGND